MERLFEDAGDVIDILDQIAVFDKGLCRPSHIRFLEHIMSQQMAVHLTGDRDQRYTVSIGSREGCDQICRPGAGTCDTDCRSAGDPRISRSGMTCCLLLAHQDMCDRRLVIQRLVKWRYRDTGDPEDPGDPFCLQALHHSFCSVDHNYSLSKKPGTGLSGPRLLAVPVSVHQPISQSYIS